MMDDLRDEYVMISDELRSQIAAAVEEAGGATQVARAAGMRRATVWEAAYGRSSPRVVTVARIAAVCGRSLGLISAKNGANSG